MTLFSYPTVHADLSFAAYIAQCITFVKAKRGHVSEAVIAANTPFELLPAVFPARVGVLLVHGLLDSPFYMRDIGTYLQSQGCLVRSILLPGHGTVPEDLLNVTWQEWLDVVDYGVASLEKEVEFLFLVGFSTGGALTFYQALQHTSKINGVILIAPAFKIHSRWDFLTEWHHRMHWKGSRAKWLSVKKEIDYAKYQSIPFHAVYQVYDLGKKIKNKLEKDSPSFPQLLIVSQEDEAICTDTAVRYFLKDSRPENEMILYSATPVAWNDSRMVLRHSVYPNWNIRSFSHITLPISPENSHYGMQGEYLFASHIEHNKKIIYGGVSEMEKKLFDVLNQLKWPVSRRERLTFNPDFDFLKERIGSFIEKIIE